MQQRRVGFSGSDRPDDSQINACVHCGICLPVCPTYRETSLEMSSPRGRISLMEAVSLGHIGLESDVFREQMSQCLNCRACEAICPSGVGYGHLLETSRAQIEQSHTRALGSGADASHPTLPPRPLWQRMLRTIVFEHLFQDIRLFRGACHIFALYQQSGLQWLVRTSGLLRLLRLAEHESLLPRFSSRFLIPQGQIHRACGERRATVALLTGCIMSTAFTEVHEATIRVLQQNGCDVVLPPDQGCCGALHLHSGDMDGGRAVARRIIAAFSGLGVDAIVVNAAGCGSTLKEYGHLLHDDPSWSARAQRFASQVQDIQEFLTKLPLNRELLGHLPVRVTYQEPCHLAHAQRITQAPRVLLQAIPGLELREMAESAVCCGSAGVYNLLEPEMARRLGLRKVDHALATGAIVIATANPGCALQLAAALRWRKSHVQVCSVVELLDASYCVTLKKMSSRLLFCTAK